MTASTSARKIRIVFPDRERLIEKVRREHRTVNMIAHLEEAQDGQFVLVLNDESDIEHDGTTTESDATTSAAPKTKTRGRSSKSFVDFKGSDEFNRFISILHRHLIDIVEHDPSSDCIVRLSNVKKHFYEMNPPYAPKDIILAFSHLAKNGLVTPVGNRNTQYKVLV
jgi:hypothetical protein